MAFPADHADRLARYIGEGDKAINPLVEKYPAMHEDQRSDAPLGDHPYAHDCLPKRRGRSENSAIVRKQSAELRAAVLGASDRRMRPKLERFKSTVLDLNAIRSELNSSMAASKQPLGNPM